MKFSIPLILCFLLIHLINFSKNTFLTNRNIAQVLEKDWVDIVFDIDWTLVYSVDQENGNIEVENKWYRLADHSVEIISLLLERPYVRISFFSGGDKSRNDELLKNIKLPNGKTLYDIAYKILSREDLTLRPHMADQHSGKMHERYYKDINLIRSDLGQIVLIDDTQFTHFNQKENLLWLNKTLNFFESYEQTTMDLADEYRPNSFVHWWFERKKILLVGYYLQQALDRYQNSDEKFLRSLGPIKTLQQLANEFQNLSYTDLQNLIKKFPIFRTLPAPSSDCNQLVLSFQP